MACDALAPQAFGYIWRRSRESVKIHPDSRAIPDDSSEEAAEV